MAHGQDNKQSQELAEIASRLLLSPLHHLTLSLFWTTFTQHLLSAQEFPSDWEEMMTRKAMWEALH